METIDPVAPSRLAVVMDLGASAGVLDVVAAARGVVEPVFLVGPEAECDGLYELCSAEAPTHRVRLSASGAVLGLCRREGLTRITTYCDRWVPLADGVGAALAGVPAVPRRWEKSHQRAVFNRHGLSRIRSAQVRSVDAVRRRASEWGYPLILKPQRGVSSRDITVVEGEGDLVERVAALPLDSYTLESFAPHHVRDGRGGYLSVEVFRGSTERAFVSDRLPLHPPASETGIVGPALLDPEGTRTALDTARRALDALGLGCGTFHVELRARQPERREFEVIEVNGRLGGHVARMMRLACGHDVVRDSLLAASGRPLPTAPLAWTKHVCCLLLPAPRDAVVVTGAPTRRQLLALDGVVELEIVRKAGAELDWRRGTENALCALWIVADTGAELGRMVAGAAATLAGRYLCADAEGRPAAVSARWLAQLGTVPAGALEVSS